MNNALYMNEGFSLCYFKNRKTPGYVIKVKRRLNAVYKYNLLVANIRSMARLRMYTILDFCHKNRIEVCRCHIDSITIKMEDQSKLDHFIGTNIGMLKVEKRYPNGCFIKNVNEIKGM